jgi:hypothetical protein
MWESHPLFWIPRSSSQGEALSGASLLAIS